MMIFKMQAWVVSDPHIYQALVKRFEREPALVLDAQSHSLGFQTLLVSKEAAPAFGVLLVSDQPVVIFQGMQWAHKNWQVSDFVSLDALTGLSSGYFAEHEYRLAIPKHCLRSAGRGDLQSGPLLFEEVAFSDSVQMGLATTYSDLAPLFLDPQLNLFSGTGLDHDFNFERTISENVQCFAWDSVSAEVLQSSKRLAVRAGALFVVTPRHEYRLGAFDAFLRQQGHYSF